LHHDSTLSHTSFLSENFWPKTTWLHPPYFSLFPGLRIKFKGRHFDTSELNEAGGATNTLTKHYFKEKMAEALETVHTRGSELLLKLWWPVGSKS
jgi:hypothetical protein